MLLLLHEIHSAERAVDGLCAFCYQHTQRVEVYRKKRLTDTRAHDLVVRSVDAGVMGKSFKMYKQ